MPNDKRENIIAGSEGWLEYQMHVLTTMKRLDEVYMKLEHQLREIEKKQSKDMTDVKEEIFNLKSLIEGDLNAIKIQMKVDELERAMAGIEAEKSKVDSAKEEGAWGEKVERHIEKRTKVNWIIMSAAIGSGFAIINLIIKFIMASIGLG